MLRIRPHKKVPLTVQSLVSLISPYLKVHDAMSLPYPSDTGPSIGSTIRCISRATCSDLQQQQQQLAHHSREWHVGQSELLEYLP